MTQKEKTPKEKAIDAVCWAVIACATIYFTFHIIMGIYLKI